jgi:hypothetical protein
MIRQSTFGLSTFHQSVFDFSPLLLLADLSVLPSAL